MATQAEYEAYLELVTQQLAALYGDVQRKVQRELRRGVGLTGAARYEREEILKQVKAITKGVRGTRPTTKLRSALATRKLTETGYTLGIDIAEEGLRASGIKLAAANYGATLHRSAIQVIAEQMALDLSDMDDQILKVSRRILMPTQQTVLQEQAINKLIGQGVVRGQSRRDVSRQLTAQLRKQLDDGQFVTINGRNYQPEKYAELVARTRTREAVTQGTINTNLQYKNDLVQISVHENACPICQQYQGRVYSISGESKDFPALPAEGTPPIHPNCAHTMTGYVPVEEGDKEYMDLARLSNANGLVHGYDDYQRVLGGGRMKRKPLDIPEETRVRKAAAKRGRAKAAEGKRKPPVKVRLSKAA